LVLDKGTVQVDCLIKYLFFINLIHSKVCDDVRIDFIIVFFFVFSFCLEVCPLECRTGPEVETSLEIRLPYSRFSP
jgi:hypothetical protein